MLKKVALAALTAALLTSGAEAATQTGTFTVSATFNPTCTLDTSSAAHTFGTIGATVSNFQNFVFSSLFINCSTGTPYAVTLASSHIAGGPVSTGFNMANAGGQLMSYRLYPNLFTNAPWDASGVSANASFTGNGGAQEIRMYGEIPSQTPAAGSWTTGAFTDTVTATVTY